MYVVKEIVKKCCTCDRWAGLRALEEGGFVYSLENVEGICKGAVNAMDGVEPARTLTLPTATCSHWEKWSDFTLHGKRPQEINAYRARA